VQQSQVVAIKLGYSNDRIEKILRMEISGDPEN
jgi:hypothetical protein